MPKAKVPGTGLARSKFLNRVGSWVTQPVTTGMNSRPNLGLPLSFPTHLRDLRLNGNESKNWSPTQSFSHTNEWADQFLDLWLIERAESSVRSKTRSLSGILVSASSCGRQPRRSTEFGKALAIRFREGFDTGLLAVQFTPQGSLIAGGTNRGWPVRGPKAYAVQRLDWTGITPFEIKEIKAKPQGFEISFTKPVNREIASKPDTYQLKTFTHVYQQGYGSPEVDQTIPQATQAVVSEDAMKVEITVDGLVQGHVHDFYLPAMRSEDQEELLHLSPTTL